MAQTPAGDDVWVLGATGRSGQAIADRLLRRGVTTVLVGRDRARLDAVAARLGGAPEVLASASVAEMAGEVRRRRPAVVVNTIGPFSETAVPVARACLPHGHYVDLANDVAAVRAVLALDADATAAGRALITGAGFGFVATEAVVSALCSGRPHPASVRVDAIPSLALEPGRLGEALAATIIEGLPAGGRRYAGGRLVASGLGSEPRVLVTPDGDRVTTAAAPLGDLHAAWLTSRAPEVVAASSEVPSIWAARAAARAGGVLARSGPVRRFLIRRLAAVKLKARPPSREHSWGHADVRWPDGSRGTGWLRTGDAMEFTVAVAAEVAVLLLSGSAAPGASTPVAALGLGLLDAVGAELLLGEPDPDLGQGADHSPVT